MADENTLQTGIVGMQHRDTTIKVKPCNEIGANVCGTKHCSRGVGMVMSVTQVACMT